jgi:drug/metabolite transporter (DMT)-like permease
MAVTAREAAAPDQTTTSRSGVWFTEVMLLGMALIWGMNYSVVKYGTRFVPSLAYNGVRIALASVVFAVIARKSEPKPSRRTAWILVALGMIGHGVYQVFFILGLARSRAGTVAVVLAATPAFIGLIGRFLGTEIVSRRRWFGIALQIAGVACVVLNSSAQSNSGDTPLGMLLLLCGAMAWALFSVLAKPYVHDVSTLQFAALTVIGGGVLVTVVGLPAISRLDWSAVPPTVWIAVVYSGVGAMVISNLFWARGVRILGPIHVSMFSNLQPAIALIVAWLGLGEIPTLWQVLGAASIMSGLVVSRIPGPAS